MPNPFEQFHNDIIRIISKNGSHTSIDLKANVTPGTINIYDVDIDIVEGDIVERDLPKGRIETYEVIEANYKQKFSAFPAHYNLKVRKTTAIKPALPVKNIFNLTGNARVYQHSTDNSINNINQNPNDIFNELREFIEYNIKFNSNLLDALKELEASKGTKSYSDLYLKFVSVAADHIGILATFLPALATLAIK